MRKLLLFLVASVFVVSACKKEPGYKIKGNIEGLGDSQVFLRKVEDNQWVKFDSVKAESGEFLFEGKLKSPEMYALTLGDEGSVNIFTENSDIQITGNIDSLNAHTVKGSGIHDKFEHFKSKVGKYDEEMGGLYTKYQEQRQKGNQEGMKKVEEEYMAVSDNRQEFVRKYIEDNTNSVISPYVATQEMLPYMKYEELDSLYISFDSSVKESRYAQRIKERRDVLARVQMGKEFIDFTLPDTAGNSITFSDYIGDGHILLDFWASWCSPCRKENPNLVENYKKYQDQGFEIFGVSLDRKRDPWIQAIHNDNIDWPQASDLKGWDNPTRKEYGVMAIPSNFLIDEEGVIVAKDLRGEELDQKLEEIYGNN